MLVEESSADRESDWVSTDEDEESRKPHGSGPLVASNQSGRSPPLPEKMSRQFRIDTKENFKRLAEVKRKGINGSPTYDTLGYELDKDKIINRRITYYRRDEWEIKAHTLGVWGRGPHFWSPFMTMAWDDKVSRDLGIAYHEVGLEEYALWKQRGFEARESDFKDLSKEERERITRLASGSVLRKGAKR